jgi:hypothetical protein
MEIRDVFGSNSGQLWLMAALLFIFGAAYNAAVTWLNRRGMTEGYTWLLVAIGTAVTLLASGPVIGWDNVIRLFILFVASGAFMAGGDIYRYLHNKAAENKSKRDDFLPR